MEIYKLSYPAKAKAVRRDPIAASTDVCVAEWDGLNRRVTIGLARDGFEFVVVLSEKDIVEVAGPIREALAAIVGDGQ